MDGSGLRRVAGCILAGAALTVCAGPVRADVGPVVQVEAGAHAAAEDEDVVAGASTTLDYPAFYDCLDGPNAPVAAGCSTSNFHPDGHVDLRDFAVLQRSYRTLSPSAIQPGAETVGEIAPIDDIDVFTFLAPQGAFVTVDFSTPTVNSRPDLVPRLDLIRPDATVASTVPSCDFTARLDNIAVNQ
ncbi:MAG: hypothetical protein AAB341_04845, partial [Planctomycetota bacterium]